MAITHACIRAAPTTLLSFAMTSGRSLDVAHISLKCAAVQHEKYARNKVLDRMHLSAKHERNLAHLLSGPIPRQLFLLCNGHRPLKFRYRRE